MARSSVLNKLNSDPYATRGEEIQTRYEDDYKFHRYTNRYGNAFGSEFYSIKITCRSILTDPEVHQKLHDYHYEQQSRYYGYWYGQDLFTYNSKMINQYIDNHHQPSASYRYPNQSVPSHQFSGIQNTPRSLQSSRETGYISDSNSTHQLGNRAHFGYPGGAVPIRTTDEAIYLQRDEMETEIF
eukprot:TCALIF_02973-PB protein Name:"Protein of unknown function" AED:0.68 eAED:0.68 QI:0/0.33/0.5/0.5/1/1/4/0/183